MPTPKLHYIIATRAYDGKMLRNTFSYAAISGLDDDYCRIEVSEDCENATRFASVEEASAYFADMVQLILDYQIQHPHEQAVGEIMVLQNTDVPRKYTVAAALAYPRLLSPRNAPTYTL